MNQIVLPETGATIKPGPMITVVPSRRISDEQLAHFGEGTGLNGPFLADILSACVTHQRMGGNLFRMLESRTANPVFQAMYAELLASGEQSVAACERLIGQLGGNPQYASPPARLQEGMDAKVIESLLLSGSADLLSLETAGLMAAYCALVLSLLHAETLETLAGEATDSDAKQALVQGAREIAVVARSGRDQTREAMDKALLLQAKHPVGQKLMQGMEKVTAAVRDKFR
jgi:hypothetical protein